MPIIRVTYPEKGLTNQQKDKLAPLLIDAVMRQESTQLPRRPGTSRLSCSTRFPKRTAK